MGSVSDGNVVLGAPNSCIFTNGPSSVYAPAVSLMSFSLRVTRWASIVARGVPPKPHDAVVAAGSRSAVLPDVETGLGSKTSPWPSKWRTMSLTSSASPV